MKKLKQKNIYSLHDSSARNNNSTGIMRDNESKRELNLNDYKTIIIKNQYKSNTINNIISKGDNYNNKNLKIIHRPVSAYNKCLLGIYNYNFKHHSKSHKFENLKFISDDSNIGNLNSDIIKFI